MGNVLAPDGRRFTLTHDPAPRFTDVATGRVFAVRMPGGGKLHLGDEVQAADMSDLPAGEIEAAHRRAYGLAPPDSDDGAQADNQPITMAHEPPPFARALAVDEVEAAVTRAYA